MPKSWKWKYNFRASWQFQPVLTSPPICRQLQCWFLLTNLKREMTSKGRELDYDEVQQILSSLKINLIETNSNLNLIEKKETERLCRCWSTLASSEASKRNSFSFSGEFCHSWHDNWQWLQVNNMVKSIQQWQRENKPMENQRELWRKNSCSALSLQQEALLWSSLFSQVSQQKTT